MFKTTAIAFVLAGATALTPAAFAASKAASTTTAQTSQGMDQSASASQGDTEAAQDFQKLSKDGFEAFKNVQMARLAIFDGKTDQAKALVDKASELLKSAKTDGSAFEKAESQLKAQSPHSADTMSANKMDQSTNGKSSDSAKSASTDATNASSSKTDMASNDNSAPDQSKTWLPIDGQVMLGADYQVSDANTQAVQDANKAMKAGNTKEAHDQLKLAGVDVSFAVALVPLDQTVQDVQQAQSDLGAGKFYEANLDLKKVQDSIVVAEADAIGVPDSSGANDHAANAADQSGSQSSASNGQTTQNTAMTKTGDMQSGSSSKTN